MERLLNYARSFLGVPYKFGGRNRLEGLDCSQFVIEVLISAGILPHGSDTTAQGLYEHFEKYGELNKYGPGALAFFGRDTDHINHIGLCIDEKVMIEAGGGDSTTTTLQAAIEKNACIRERQIKYRKDFFCVIMPKYAETK